MLNNSFKLLTSTLTLEPRRLEVQLFAAAVWAVIWYFALSWLTRWLFSRHRNYVIRHQIAYLKRKEAKALGMLPEGKAAQSDEAMLEEHCGMVAVFFQHTLGGLMCAPSVYGLLRPGLASILAAHGGLCELGWEIEDTVKQLWEARVLGTKPKKPISHWVFMMLHHACGMLCVIPLNLYFKDEPLYHAIIFDLQLGGAVSGILGTVGKMQDASIPAQYRNAKIVGVLSFVNWMYFRVWRFAVDSFGLLCVIWAREPFMGFFACLLVPLLAMILFTIPVTGLFVKMVNRDVFQPRKPNPELEELNRQARFALKSEQMFGPPSMLGRAVSTPVIHFSLSHRKLL